jgi:RpiR family transcriptional regulator, carbohydrate utilization regulator
MDMPDEMTASGKTELLTRVADAMPGMSKSDRKIAELLLHEPLKFAHASVRTLANEIGISEPTVIRFCRTIGCDGFKDLKFQIAQELAVRQALRDSHGNMAAAGKLVDLEFRDIRERTFRGAVDALTRAYESFDAEGLGRAGRAIAAAGRVVIYGIGGSSAALAAELHNRLFRLRVPSSPFADSYLLRMSAATLGKEDVAIFISSTGRPRELQDSLELAKYYGATCIGITPADSPLGKEVDVCLNVNLSQSGVDELQPNPMRFAQLYIIDSLAFNVALELGEKALSALRKTRASVASLHGIASQQPIGD